MIGYNDITVSIANGTDFGGTPVFGGIVDRTFVITNPSAVPLNITDISIVYTPTKFSILTPTSMTILPGGTANLTIQFDPDYVGHSSATLQIFSDANNSAFGFWILAKGISADITAPIVSIAGFTGVVTGLQTAVVALSEDSTDFVVGDLTLTNATATLSGPGSSYTAVLTPIADGAVALSVGVGAFTDAAGNSNSVASNTVLANTAPTIIVPANAAAASVNAAENQTAVTDLATTDDASSEASGLTYALTGGADQGKFDIDGDGGVLTFRAAPDFETPTDSGLDGIYEVQVTVTDAGALTDVINIAVTVTDFVVEDVAGASVEITDAPAQFTGVTPFSLSFTFNEAVTGFDLSDISAALSNATASGFSATITSVYTALIIPTSAGDVVIGVNAGAAYDGSGNLSDAAVPVIVRNDNIAATQQIISEFSGARNSLLLSNQRDPGRRINRINGTPSSQGSASASFLGFSPHIPWPMDIHISKDLMAYSATLSNFAGEAVQVGPNISSWDIWSTGSLIWFDDQATDGGFFGLASIGVDYLASPNVLLGVQAQMDWMQQQFLGGIGQIEGVGWMVGPYALVKLDDSFYIDLSASWGQSNNTASPFGTYSDEFGTDRWMVSGALIDAFDIGDWILWPVLSVQFIEENRHAYVDGLGNLIPGQSNSQGDLRFAPRVSYSHTLEDGTNLTPWASLTGVYSFGATGVPGSFAANMTGLSASASAGVDIYTIGGVKLALNVLYGGIGKSSTSFGGSVSFSVPLN